MHWSDRVSSLLIKFLPLNLFGKCVLNQSKEVVFYTSGRLCGLRKLTIYSTIFLTNGDFPAFMAPSEPSRRCTGSILCPMRSSAGDRPAEHPGTIAVFTDLVTFCDDLMTTLLESSTSPNRHLQTGDDLQADHAAAGSTTSARTCNILI